MTFDEAIAYRPSAFQRARWAISGAVAWIGRDLENAALRFLLRREIRDSNLIKHARQELSTIYDLSDTEEGPNKWAVESILELLALFSRQGHSGSSASYVVSMFKTLAMFEPIGPLTGADSEWTALDYGDEMKWQNKRCGHVFKGADGRAYDSEGRIFREPDGCCFTSRDSRVYIEFPYTPKREYVDVPADRS